MADTSSDQDADYVAAPMGADGHRWLARSSRRPRHQIAVTGLTEAEARTNFEDAWRAWNDLCVNRPPDIRCVCGHLEIAHAEHCQFKGCGCRWFTEASGQAHYLPPPAATNPIPHDGAQ